MECKGFIIDMEGAKIDTGSFTKMFKILGNHKATIFSKPSQLL